MSGWFKLYRGYRDNQALLPSKHFSDVEAWLWLLENCAWKTLVRATGKGEVITLEPGQIHVSERSLATAWGWDRKRIWRFLGRLEAAQMCMQLRGQSGTVLTIENWAKYQSEGAVMGAAKGAAKGQLRGTQEEGKEGKEEKNNNYAFCGRVIKLDESDFINWGKNYPDIDLRAALQSRDDWLANQASASAKDNWFMSTSNWLASKQREARNGQKLQISLA